MSESKLNQILGGGRRTQVYVYHDLSKGHTWNQPIYLSFKPRQCIVRQAIASALPAVNEAVYVIRGISLDDTILAIVSASNIPVDSGVVIDLSGKHIGGTLQFQLQELSGSALPGGPISADEISLVLEFVE